jgi:hypothetical protein
MTEEDNEILSKLIIKYYNDRDLIQPETCKDKIINDKTINKIINKKDFQFTETSKNYLWILIINNINFIFDMFRKNNKVISSNVIIKTYETERFVGTPKLKFINFMGRYYDIIEINEELIKFLSNTDTDLYRIYSILEKIGKLGKFHQSDNEKDNVMLCKLIDRCFHNNEPIFESIEHINNDETINYIITKPTFEFTEILSKYIFSFFTDYRHNETPENLAKRIQFFKTYDKKFSSNLIIKIDDSIPNKNRNTELFFMFLKYFHKSIEVNIKLIKYLLLRHRYFINDTLKLFDINQIDDEVIALLIDNDNYEIYTKLVESEIVKPSITHLEWACSAFRVNPELINFILTHKIIPSHKCCELLMIPSENPVYSKHENITFCSPYILNKFSNYNKSDILSSLINCGLSITLNDVKELALYNIEVKNFKDLDIQTDKELVMICLEHYRFRFKYFDNFDFQEILPELFKYVHTIQELKLFIGNRIYKYNTQCLINACNLGNNNTIVKFLLKQGVVPDIECLKITIHKKGASIRTIRDIFDVMYDNKKNEMNKDEKVKKMKKNKDEKPKKAKKVKKMK